MSKKIIGELTIDMDTRKAMDLIRFPANTGYNYNYETDENKEPETFLGWNDIYIDFLE